MWTMQRFAIFRDGWDAIGPVVGITLAQLPRGEHVTFARPPCPMTSLPSTRERVVHCSLRTASGRSAMPPQSEEVVI
jgi:hypothetical protein